MGDRLPRKLAAILYADVAGYSRLTGEDEDATHRTLGEYLDLIAGTVESHLGSVMHYAGDAVLAKFDASVDAMSAAVAIQNELRIRNATVPDAQKVQFRIGVNSGDVIEDRGDIYGDGVNVAARLEALADPGGICISDAVRTALGAKLDLDYEFMGEQEVKNISEPVRAYCARLKPGAMPPQPVNRPKPVKPSRTLAMTRKSAAMVAAVVLVAAVGVLGWLKPWEPQEEPASVERMAFPLPENPSIAVLPFDNLSGDAEQEYVSDGLTENIITALSQVPDMFVIARNSTFVYKGTPVKVQRVAEELGVRYVVEGSFQREGDQIRVHVQLIDALRGRHLWAERFDRKFAGIFALQDDVTGNVVAALEVKLTEEQKARLARRYTDNVDAYDRFLHGQSLLLLFTKDDNAHAQELFRQAIDLDPQFARAYGALAIAHAQDFRFGWTSDTSGSTARSLELARAAAKIDASLPQVQMALGQALAFSRQHAAAIDAAKKATDLDPNYADAYGLLAMVQTFVGRADLALTAIDKAMRLNPRPTAIYSLMRGRALLFTERLEEARRELRASVEMNSSYLVAQVYLAVAYGQLGQVDDAEWQGEEILALEPDFSIQKWTDSAIYTDADYVKSVSDGLRKAGLPE